MSSWIRCNRCGTEVDVSAMAGSPESVNPLVKTLGVLSGIKSLSKWTRVDVAMASGSYIASVKPAPVRFDLCEDCREVLLEQFMVGAEVAAITQPSGRNPLPHDNQPYQDCLLAFDPSKGRFICEHDDPERFLKLQRDRAQNVAEGVPEQPVKITQDQIRQMDAEPGTVWNPGTKKYITRDEDPELFDALTSDYQGMVQPSDRPYPVCRYCNCTGHPGLKCSSTGCDCLVSEQGEELSAAYSSQEPAGAEITRVQKMVHLMVQDTETAEATGSIPQRCGSKCDEAHTYKGKCLLKEAVDEVRRKPLTRLSRETSLFRESGMEPRLKSGSFPVEDGVARDE